MLAVKFAIINKQLKQLRGLVLSYIRVGWKDSVLSAYPPPPSQKKASIALPLELPALHILNRQQICRLKIEFTSFHSSLRLFQITLVVSCRRALLALNYCERYSSWERDRKQFRRCSFTSSMKFRSRKFQVVVLLGREGDVPKSVPHLQNYCYQ